MTQGAPLDCRREQFDLPPDLHYLNCAYMSPLPRAVMDAGVEGIRRKADPSGIGPTDFFEGSDRIRARFAALVNAPRAESVALVPAASYAVATAVANLDIRAEHNVVLTMEQFPGNVYSWRDVARRSGAELRTVEPSRRAERGGDWNRRLLEAIDARTAVVTLGPVHWTDGTRFDLGAIAGRAREVGAALIVDGTQSVGAQPIDVTALAPDMLVAAAYKWLLGPYSIGCAYFGPRFADARPLEETWIARLGSENFSGLVDYVDEYQPGAIRFDVGERSNFILGPMLERSLELVLELDPRWIGRYIRDISAPLVAAARELGFGVEEDDWRADHMFGIRVPEHVDLERVQRLCGERRVFVSQRGNALRISPHVYNTAEDVGALIGVLTESVA